MRSSQDIERWYEEWNGIVDSLLLTDLNLFLIENRPLIRAIFRKVFHMCMHNVDEVTSYWKEFTNYYWNTVSRSVTLSEFEISVYNPFRKLLTYGPLREILTHGIETKLEATSVAHLVSTRQMVQGSYATQLKALDKFHATTSVGFQPTSVNMERARLHAGFVGRKCRDLCKTKDLKALCHISISTAGDIDYPKVWGGRGAAINYDIIDVLDDYAVHSGEVKLPFGITVREEQGLPRYCTWGRPKNLSVRAHVRCPGFPGCGSSMSRSLGGCSRCRFVPAQCPVYGFGNLRLDTDTEAEGQKQCFEGYDEYLGLQIFYVALYIAFNEGYMDMEGNFLKPVPAKTSVVPEPGGKARIVTVTKWWVQILEQPFGHLTKTLLSGHPSASAGLTRADQAWLYLSQLQNVTVIPDAYVLSSDLEEATDAIAPAVAETMIRAFYDHIYGYIPKLIEIGIAVGLRSTRSITISYPRSSGRKDLTFIKRRGILMGEPVTKSLLTLYSLVCEEAAIRDYIHMFSYAGISNEWELSMIIRSPNNVRKKFHVRKGQQWREALNVIRTIPESRIDRLSIRRGTTGLWTRVKKNFFEHMTNSLNILPPEQPDITDVRFGGYSTTDTYSGEVRVPWRAFAVGGDDHIAYGPRAYLELITSNHFAFGSKISLPKHGFSNVAVKFCEKILLLRDRDPNVSTWDINNDPDSYEKSVWVDSIKVRLLSPLTKSMECEDDRNTAIGKSGSLSRSLAWLSPVYFSNDWCNVVLQRFVGRMYPYLPNPIGKNAAIFNVLKLPPALGGLGLMPKGEHLMDVISFCPAPTRAFVKILIKSLTGEDIGLTDENFARLVRAHRRLCTANSARGIAQESNTHEVEEFLLRRKSYSIAEIREKFPRGGMRALFTAARANGYYTMDEAVAALSRSTTFLDALLSVKRSSYATSKWRSRYHQLWKFSEAVGVQGLTYGKVRVEPFTIEDYSMLENLKIEDILPVRFYNLFESVPELLVQARNPAVTQRASALALLFGKGKNTAMASASTTLLELSSKGLPDLNLRMDFHANIVHKVRLEPVVVSDSDTDDLSEFLRMPISTEVSYLSGEEE
jgi:hypothetical protein